MAEMRISGVNQVEFKYDAEDGRGLSSSSAYSSIGRIYYIRNSALFFTRKTMFSEVTGEGEKMLLDLKPYFGNVVSEQLLGFDFGHGADKQNMLLVSSSNSDKLLFLDVGAGEVKDSFSVLLPKGFNIKKMLRYDAEKILLIGENTSLELSFSKGLKKPECKETDLLLTKLEYYGTNGVGIAVFSDGKSLVSFANGSAKKIISFEEKLSELPSFESLEIAVYGSGYEGLKGPIAVIHAKEWGETVMIVSLSEDKTLLRKFAE